MMPVSTGNSKQHYRPFGETIEAPKDDVGYTGHKFDTDLGLSYMQARYFNPVTGRFLSNDPVGFRGVHSFNRYAYVNNNPYKYVDPTGKSGVKLRDVKKALKEVHKKLGGKLLKNDKGGKFGSSSHGDGKKGYRLDKEGHPNAPEGSPDADGPHINFWDFTKMKAKTAKQLGKLDEVSGAVRIGDTAKKAASSVIGAVIIGVEFMEQKMPRTTQLVEALIDPIGTLTEGAKQADPNAI
jgi:RHS repeat-associated protein